MKIANEHISFTFSDICNTSFNEGIFPDKNKLAKVVPIHKDGSTKEINNYRPISLLSIFSKIMEKIVAVRLNNFLELLSIIFPNQFEFRSGCSTTHALISITQAINKTIDNQKFGCGVFIDLKKAIYLTKCVDSDTKNISCGVPQGSVLGPLLFLFHIDDFPNISLKLKFILFADDTNIYFECKDLKNLEKNMNSELKILY